jgi:ComF family protein
VRERSAGHGPPRRLPRLLDGLLHPLLNFLYPHLCLSCGRPLAGGESLLCASCTRLSPRLDRDDATLCRARTRCLRECGIEDLNVLWHFDGPARDLIHSIKYGGLRSAAEEAGVWLGGALEGASDRWLPDLIVPIPLHPARVRERGYNQSACIARGVARILGVPLREDAAVRTRNTAPQTSLDRNRRRDNVAGAFRVRRPDAVRDANVLIVDDVVTTGATARALATALREAGARCCALAALAIARSDMQ